MVFTKSLLATEQNGNIVGTLGGKGTTDPVSFFLGQVVCDGGATSFVSTRRFLFAPLPFYLLREAENKRGKKQRAHQTQMWYFKRGNAGTD